MDTLSRYQKLARCLFYNKNAAQVKMNFPPDGDAIMIPNENGDRNQQLRYASASLHLGAVRKACL